MMMISDHHDDDDHDDDNHDDDHNHLSLCDVLFQVVVQWQSLKLGSAQNRSDDRQNYDHHDADDHGDQTMTMMIIDDGADDIG